MPDKNLNSSISGDMSSCVRTAVQTISSGSRFAITTYLLSLRNHDGGYRGRHRASDLYYTFFSLMLLDCLAETNEYSYSSQFLESYLQHKELSFIDHVCLLRCLARVMPEQPMLRVLLSGIEKYRSKDGGYSPILNSHTTTTYAPFVVSLAYEECDLALPGFSRVADSLKSLQLFDGGYVNDSSISISAVPSTAAAVMIMRHYAGYADSSGIDFLLRNHTASGGFKSTEKAPQPDLLSTATALYTLRFSGAELAPIRESCIGYVESLWDNAGGFLAHEGDTFVDCEYTFYGLLALGSLLL